MERDEIIVYGILIIAAIIIFGGGETLKPKDPGELCENDEECLSKTCLLKINKSSGYCEKSSVDEECNSISDCKEGICKSNKCTLSGFLGECKKDSDCSNGNTCLKDKCVNDNTLKFCEKLSPYAHLQVPFFLFGIITIIGAKFGFGRNDSIEARGVKITGAYIIGAISLVLWIMISFIC